MAADVQYNNLLQDAIGRAYTHAEDLPADLERCKLLYARATGMTPEYGPGKAKGEHLEDYDPKVAVFWR